MTTTSQLSTISNSFSWQRVRMIGEYYYPSLRLQILIYPLFSILCGIIIAIGRPTMLSLLNNSAEPSGLGLLSTMAIGLSGTVSAFMFYFAPIVFIRRSRDIDVALPALWKEKAAFVVLYLFIFIPVIIYGPTFIIRLISDAITNPELTTDFTFREIVIGSQSITIDTLKGFIPMAVCAYFIFSRPKPTFGRAAGFSILSLVVMGLIASGIYVICMWGTATTVIHAINTDTDISIDDTMVLSSLNMARYIEATVCIAVTAIFLWLTIRSFKKIQV